MQALRTALCLCLPGPSPLSSHGTLIIAFAVKGDSVSMGFSSSEGIRETLNHSSMKLSRGTHKLRRADAIYYGTGNAWNLYHAYWWK